MGRRAPSTWRRAKKGSSPDQTRRWTRNDGIPRGLSGDAAPCRPRVAFGRSGPLRGPARRACGALAWMRDMPRKPSGLSLPGLARKTSMFLLPRPRWPGPVTAIDAAMLRWELFEANAGDWRWSFRAGGLRKQRPARCAGRSAQRLTGPGSNPRPGTTSDRRPDPVAGSRTDPADGKESKKKAPGTAPQQLSKERVARSSGRAGGASLAHRGSWRCARRPATMAWSCPGRFVHSA